jgi:hypothetical protein
MADYYPTISRAVAALDEKSSDTRRAVYDRARTTLVDHFQKVDPPLSVNERERERLTLEDAIRKVEADAILSEVTSPIPDRLAQSNDGKSESSSQQTEPANDALKRVEYLATRKAWSGPPDAKQQRERRFTFWGFLIFSALQIGYLFYRPPTFSKWQDWIIVGGAILFTIMAILSYLSMRKNWSAEQTDGGSNV